MRAERFRGALLATLIIASLMAMSFLSISQASAQPPGMVSYWTFDDGTAKDIVGTNDGTIYGATPTAGIVGGALSFDGVDDYVNCENGESLNITDAITVEAWIKPISAGYDYIMSVARKGDAYFVGLDSDSFKGHIRFELQTSPSSSLYTRSNGQVNLDVWNHIAVTADTDNMIFYINGVQDRVIGPRNVYGVSPHNLVLGTSVYGGFASAFFNGAIDEVAIYDRALTIEEIQQHYQNGLKGLGYTAPPVIPATIDINPNTLNLRSKGRWITCFIELQGGYSAENIDVSTIRLIVDNDNVAAEPKPTMIVDKDNKVKLMVKFSRAAVHAIVSVGEVELTVTGLVNSTPFEGNDTIRVIKPGKADLELRFMDIPSWWAAAPPEEKGELEIEFMEIPMYWAAAPS